MSDEIQASHILVKSEKEADFLLEELKNKKSFPQLAEKYSLCPSKSQGGDLGWFSRGMMVAEFESAAFKAKLNTPLKVKTEFGWHVIIVTDSQ